MLREPNFPDLPSLSIIMNGSQAFTIALVVVNGAPVRAPQDTARLPSGDTSNSAQAALEDAGLGSMT